jgi:prepilin-type N-terminal cleavage/methylation domain-containing protein
VSKVKKGFTLVEIMIVVAIIALLAAIAIPNLLRARLTANESAAQANLRTISTAAETYAAANNGSYPTAESALTGASPKYLNKSFCGTTTQGYTYSCSFSSSAYTITAAAANCDVSGSKDYTITTGGVLSSADCT